MKCSTAFIELMHLRQVLLVTSALEMTGNAPMNRLVGAGNVLSEYEMYFHFALQVFPFEYSY